jgi:MFS family permease
MRRSARRYRALLTAPGVTNLLSASLVGRLPVGMAMLMFVLVVHDGTGSYPLAGFAAAVNAAATAFTAPPLGRLSDRGHAALVLVVTGVAEAAALVALVLGLKMGLSGGVIVAIAAVTGMVNPPIAAVTRVVLPRLAPDEESRRTAFALDALLIELSFVVGPALVGVVAAIWNGYAVAFLAAGLNLLGAFGLAATRSVRHGYVVDLPEFHESRWRRVVGPLTSRGLRTVMMTSVLWAAAFGVLEITIPAYTNARGLPELGGLMFALWSGGSIVGGLWYGGRDFKTPLGRLYLVFMALNVIGFGAIVFAGSLWTLGLLLFAAGLVISPTTAVEGALVTSLAPRGMTTEAFTWSGTAIYLGFALGSALASVVLSGSLGSAGALTGAALLSFGLSMASVVLIVAERRSLRAPEPDRTALTVPSVS